MYHFEDWITSWTFRLSFNQIVMATEKLSEYNFHLTTRNFGLNSFRVNSNPLSKESIWDSQILEYLIN